MEVNVKKLSENAIIPTYATDGSGCFDIYATNDGTANITDGGVFDTGLAFEVPVGHVMLVFSRSGHGFKNGVRLANCVGVIDSDYRGELKVKLHNDGIERDFVVKKGDRIAQALIVPFPRVEFLEVEELSDTSRGVGGFGSTGV